MYFSIVMFFHLTTLLNSINLESCNKYLCDPDDVIENKTSVENMLKNCNFTVFLVVEKSLNVSPPIEHRPNYLLKEAKKRAINISKMIINKNVILYIAHDEVIFYTLTDKESSKLLTEDTINEITTKTHFDFRRDQLKSINETLSGFNLVFSKSRDVNLRPDDDSYFLFPPTHIDTDTDIPCPSSDNGMFKVIYHSAAEPGIFNKVMYRVMYYLAIVYYLSS